MLTKHFRARSFAGVHLQASPHKVPGILQSAPAVRFSAFVLVSIPASFLQCSLGTTVRSQPFQYLVREIRKGCLADKQDISHTAERPYVLLFTAIGNTTKDFG